MPATKPVNRKALEAYNRVPRGKVSDAPSGFSKTPHLYGDILITGNKLGGALQRDIIYWIERHTWSHANRPEFAKLSLSTLAKLCGGVERKSIAVALRDLEQPSKENPRGRGIIEARDRTGCGKTVAKMYKLTPENWKKARAYQPPTLKDLADAQVEAEETAEQDTPVEAADELRRIVQPGKVSKPQAMRLSPSRGAPEVTLRIVYRSECAQPMTFRARPGANGRIQVTAAPLIAGEDGAKNCSRTQPQLKNSPVDSKRFAEFNDMLSSLMFPVWGKVPDFDFTAKVIEAADGAPAEILSRIARAKFRKAGERAADKYSSGILIELARDAARVNTFQSAQKRPESDRPAPGAKLSAAEIAALCVCDTCDGTGNAGTWDRGKFTRSKKLTICGTCCGTGKDPDTVKQFQSEVTF